MIVIMKNEKEFVEHLNNNMPTEEKIVMLQNEIDLLCQAGVEHLFCIRKHWKVNKTNVSELNAIAQCMFQMIWLKAKTLLQLVGGVQVHNDGRTQIVDRSSMLAVLRSMYEMCVLFNSIYSIADGEFERTILLNIWKIRGYNSRQGIKNSEEPYKAQQERETILIQELKTQALENLNKLKFSVEVEDDLKGILNYKGCGLKLYRFEKKNGTIINIEGVKFDEYVKFMPHFPETSILYNWSSMHTHATYLGLLQFGQSYNSRQGHAQLLSILQSAYILLATAIKILVDLDQPTKDLFIQQHQEIYDKIMAVVKPSE